MKHTSSKRQPKREMILASGNDRPSANAAFAPNTKRSSAADKPPRAKTKNADRSRKRGER
jgi:hypothetical protein